MLNTETQKGRETSTINNLLDERLIVLDADVNNADDCIRLMAARFEEYGYVRAGYGDAVMEREKTHPTGLPGKGINLAIPHTNNELVLKPAVGVILPRNPVKFGMMGSEGFNLECAVILPLVVKDTKQQIGMLKKISKIIGDGELLKRLRNSKSRAEILDCLSSLNNE